jgi:head-tail adaptor
LADRDVNLRDLRWYVNLVQRVQTPDGSVGISETNTPGTWVHADIQPLGGLTFWGSIQVDTPVTHRITMRWQPYLDQSYAILRVITLPNGLTRTEVFRIRRIAEIGGRHRFVECDCELERANDG